jgi:threonine/homoserine/homoserine lactone efflux protein
LTFTDNIWLFLGTVVVLSTTGVMMPGPVMAASMAKGLKHRWSGVQVALGHAVVEFPTIALIALGFSTVLKDVRVSIGVGILGGILLIYMGLSMFMSRKKSVSKLEGAKDGKTSKKKSRTKHDPFPYPPLLAGIITTATNPYYFLWWATLGAALILNAVEFGLVILVVMSILHWSIDLGWNAFLGFAVNKSKGFDERAYLAVFGLCGIIMLAFGGWFLASALKTALEM